MDLERVIASGARQSAAVYRPRPRDSRGQNAVDTWAGMGIMDKSQEIL
jgi:hypothetical protein